MAQRNTKDNAPKTKEFVAFGVKDVQTGQIIGKMKMVDPKRLEQKLRKDKTTLMAFALVVGLGLGVAGSIAIDNHIEAKEEERQIAYEQRVEEAKEIAEDRVPVFIVDHVVKYGQSYWGIAESMYEDGNSQKEAYDDMVSLNKDYTPSMLRAGTTIKVPVPGNQLENFGYTINYDILKPELEFNDKMDFIENYINNFIPQDKTQTAILTVVSGDLEDLRTYENELSGLEDSPSTDEAYREALREVDKVLYYLEEHLGTYIDGKNDTLGVYTGFFKAPRAYEMNEENLSYDYMNSLEENEKKTLG